MIMVKMNFVEHVYNLPTMHYSVYKSKNNNNNKYMGILLSNIFLF